jgi:hypothetical protein
MRTAPVTLLVRVALGFSLGVGLALGPQAALAAPRPKAPAPAKPTPGKADPKADPKADAKTAEQKEAERHFESGVALFKETKYAEALAEFERAYEIAPQPLVLYNIAGCHRELSHYAEAVTYYNRFLADGKGKVKPARLIAAQNELDGILARIARVTVTITPAMALDDVSLIVDGNTLDKPAMPLILPPGEHRLIVRAAGRQDAERSLRVASGDAIAVDLALAALPPPSAEKPAVVEHVVVDGTPIVHRFSLGAGFGTNLRRTGDSGAPSLSLGVALNSRVELGVDGVLVAYAVIPSLRVRVAGDALSLHVVGAVPISFTDEPMSSTFVAGAVGLGLRYRPMPSLAFLLESYASFAGKAHGTTVPTFLKGELWF